MLLQLCRDEPIFSHAPRLICRWSAPSSRANFFPFVFTAGRVAWGEGGSPHIPKVFRCTRRSVGRCGRPMHAATWQDTLAETRGAQPASRSLARPTVNIAAPPPSTSQHQEMRRASTRPAPLLPSAYHESGGRAAGMAVHTGERYKVCQGEKRRKLERKLNRKMVLLSAVQGPRSCAALCG